ncbi:helix-turn-helix transcriptional regulator [Arthrobacter sp. GMC3]|uniref:helix-turn-helix transcriptional regulator n=1 Tax=Arthrobacter sp. GMC3 TaxID=2058894 RepID=UPI000CE4E04E|nr:helix-turn-helix transcriptional regulator [Arthrobacter sp. GMC3]
MGQSVEFGRFLSAMRSRLQPDPDLAMRSRRVPGLRREEVARLADVSTDYYTRLEQGRNIHPSRSVLASVARALQLNDAESAHMFDLLENCGGQATNPPTVQRVRPAMRQLLEAVGEVPAVVLGRRTDVLASNRMARLLFADFPAMTREHRNYTRWIMLDPAARVLFRDWHGAASDAVAALRADIGRHPGDPAATALVGELAVNSEEFRQWWARHTVARRSSGTLALHHGVVGDVELDFEHLLLPDDPEQSLRIYTAKPGSPSLDALTLLSSWAGPAQGTTLHVSHSSEGTN